MKTTKRMITLEEVLDFDVFYDLTWHDVNGLFGCRASMTVDDIIKLELSTSMRLNALLFMSSALVKMRFAHRETSLFLEFYFGENNKYSRPMDMIESFCNGNAGINDLNATSELVGNIQACDPMDLVAKKMVSALTDCDFEHHALQYQCYWNRSPEEQLASLVGFIKADLDHGYPSRWKYE